MRFPSSDSKFALLRVSDGRPIKIEAVAADQLPDSVYEFDEVLFNLLRAAYENSDRDALAQLWAAAHAHRVTGSDARARPGADGKPVALERPLPDETARIASSA